MNSTVVFWDVDGTLLTTGRAGVFALEEAVRKTCEAPVDLQQLQTAGLTDAEVAALALSAAGIEATRERVLAFLREYEAGLPERLHWRQGRVLDGVRDVLDALAQRPSVDCLLLTGNTRAGARAKLFHYGLDGYFADGAFADDAFDRPGIARRALELARVRAAEELDLERVFVVGDTVYDVRCGRAIGARTIAVGGTTPVETLLAEEPWLALERLPNAQEFLEILGLH